MKAFCFTLTILCAVQSILAYPRPDFAISGTISGTDKVISAAGNLNAAATAAGSGTVELTSGYNTLTTVSNALQAIGDAIVDAGTQLGSALNNLASANSGPIAMAFSGATEEIDDLTDLLNSNFDGNLDTVDETGTYITTQFADAFDVIKTTLGRLAGALNALQTKVEAARNAAGSSPSVSAAIIRSRIPAKYVNDVLAEVRNLAGNMPLVKFVIDSSLQNLDMVDTFILELEEEVNDNVERYGTSNDAFQEILSDEAGNYADILIDGVGDSVSSIIFPLYADLTEISEYPSDLSGPLGALGAALTSSLADINDAIAGSFTTYSDNVDTIFGDLAGSLGSAFCSPIEAVSEVQIANGPYADFCFAKHSPRVFAQISIAIDSFDVCFEKEVGRVINYEIVIAYISEQISYNTEDLQDNLNLCLAMPTAATKGVCLATLAPYYAAIAAQVEAHLDSVADLVDAETRASYNRLGACLITSLSATSLIADEIATDANDCEDNGPQAGS
uniref:Protein TsetseEP domain-containing protein n=1 Tax=Anopheles funestus TaxID=62324 RepID=A0A4Y0BEE0_ANOFN